MHGEITTTFACKTIYDLVSGVAKMLAQWGHSVWVSDDEQGYKGRVDPSMSFAYYT